MRPVWSAVAEIWSAVAESVVQAQGFGEAVCATPVAPAGGTASQGEDAAPGIRVIARMKSAEPAVPADVQHHVDADVLIGRAVPVPIQESLAGRHPDWFSGRSPTAVARATSLAATRRRIAGLAPRGLLLYR